MFAEILGQDMLILLVVIVVVFGASRLPKIARSVGQAKGEFEKGLKDGTTQTKDTSTETKDTSSETKDQAQS
ncbi:MAG: twin-arginine translocase TatA/TatE family subunit [Actinomycetota bacterium]|nr:twin-arginine translocase TatA/TatE family subunit [Actinomycetota bacterium]